MAAVPTIGRATGVERRPTAPEADATHALYETYSRQILNYCVHQLNSREEAEDAVQTTFMNAFRGLKRGVVPEAEQAWLFKIAENVCLSRRRSSWRRGKVESPNDFEVLQEIVPSKHANRADELIGLEDALEAMPENQRRAILLREWQGLSYREIAGELELSQAAVETLIFRARRSLAAGLESPAPPKRRSRISAAADGFSLGSLITGLKSALTGGAAIHTVAAAIAAGSATVALTQAEPALLHHHLHAAKPAAAVHVTKQSQATFSSQATIVSRASGMSVAQAHAATDRGQQDQRRAQRSVTMPEDQSRAQAPPMVPVAPTPTEPATPQLPVPEAPVASAPTEQPKTDTPKGAPPTVDSPKTVAPKSEPTKSGDSPGKSGNGSEGKQGDSGAKTAGTNNGAGNAKTTTSDAPKSEPATETPPVPATTDKGNGNSNSDNKGANDKSKVSTPAAETAPVPAPPVDATTAPPAQPTNPPVHGNGNGGSDTGKGKGK